MRIKQISRCIIWLPGNDRVGETVKQSAPASFLCLALLSCVALAARAMATDNRRYQSALGKRKGADHARPKRRQAWGLRARTCGAAATGAWAARNTMRLRRGNGSRSSVCS